MPNRNTNSGNYRFGYNGMEKDPEMKGDGNSYTTEFRQYDPRLGRWLSLDPLMAQFPDMSPYVAFDNNPIYYVDPYGLSSSVKGDPVKTCVTIEGSSTENSQDNKLPENFKRGDEHTVIFTEGKYGKVIYTDKGDPEGVEKSSYGRNKNSKYALNTCFVRKMDKVTDPGKDHTDEAGQDKEEVTRINPMKLSTNSTINDELMPSTKFVKTPVKINRQVIVPPVRVIRPTPVIPIVVPVPRVPITRNINSGAVFQPNNNVLTNQAQVNQNLRALANILIANPNSSIMITANTNVPGANWNTFNPAANTTLGNLALFRAFRVMATLNRMGVPFNQMARQLGSPVAGQTVTIQLTIP